MSDFILPLDSQGVTLEAGGGKGANLSQLTQGGFPVPSGFIITSAAYLDFLRENELAERVIELAHSAHVGQPDSLEAASKSIRQLFDQAVMPTEVGLFIKASYARLGEITHGAPPLAVRSSATAEDLPEASFAGQHETFLNVRGEAELLASVKRCWSSLWTERAIAYRWRQGIDPSAVSLAVVVQELIPAESAGVMFTANPVTGARDEIIIEAAWGLGEALVGGRVTPDHIVVEKETRRIKQQSVGEKNTMTVLTTMGTEEREVEAERRNVRVLNDPQIAELAELGRAIEKYSAAPQDIEWCLAGGKVWIVQARPITTLLPGWIR